MKGGFAILLAEAHAVKYFFRYFDIKWSRNRVGVCICKSIVDLQQVIWFYCYKQHTAISNAAIIIHLVMENTAGPEIETDHGIFTLYRSPPGIQCIGIAESIKH